MNANGQFPGTPWWKTKKAHKEDKDLKDKKGPSGTDKSKSGNSPLFSGSQGSEIAKPRVRRPRVF